MQLHEIHQIHKGKRKSRVGRGGKRGTYSGRGMKGQKSRAGRNIRPMEREEILRLPKRRGSTFKKFASLPAILSLEVLDRAFRAGDKVTPKVLSDKGLVERVKGRLPSIKILGGGAMHKKLTLVGIGVSEAVKKEIERAGGTIITTEQ